MADYFIGLEFLIHLGASEMRDAAKAMHTIDQLDDLSDEENQ